MFRTNSITQPPRVSCRTSTELQSLVALCSLSLSLSEERMVITTIAPITLPHRLSPLCINHSRIPRSAPKSPRACCCCRSLSLRSHIICQGHAQAHPVSLGSTASHQSLIIHSINLLFIYSHLRCIKLRVVQATVSSKDGCRQKCCCCSCCSLSLSYCCLTCSLLRRHRIAAIDQAPLLLGAQLRAAPLHPVQTDRARHEVRRLTRRAIAKHHKRRQG